MIASLNLIIIIDKKKCKFLYLFRFLFKRPELGIFDFFVIFWPPVSLLINFDDLQVSYGKFTNSDSE